MTSLTAIQANVGSTAALTSLNAIKLSAKEVAETFIPPPAFELLARSDNAILSGPRGSGKTTLLKMLQSDALEHWRHPLAEAARRQVRSVGVFIGTDRTWHEQLVMPGFTGDSGLPVRIAWAAFGTHTFKSLIDAMRYRLLDPSNVEVGLAHLRVKFTDNEERRLCTGLAELMQFTTRPSSLRVLSQMLSSRLLDLGTARQVLRRGGTPDLPPWTDLDVISLLDAAVGHFNAVAGQPDQRWALLFDELELAPETLVQELLGALRGHQPRLIFKLSLAPANNILTALTGLNPPVPGQDYEHIPLTHARKTATLKFAQELVYETLTHLGLDPAPPVHLLLGSGVLDSADEYGNGVDEEPTNPRAPSNPYAVGSPLWHRMLVLTFKDPTFTAYLEKNHMDLMNLERLSPAQRASRLRKIRNIVVVREYFRNEYGRRRSRKSFALYSGADNVLSLPDGNPRVLIALARQLFSALQGSGFNARVTPRAQGSAVEATLQRFLPLLEAQEAVQLGSRHVSLMELLDQIGLALARRVVERDFNDNVRLTFHMDGHTVAEVEELVRKGVNTGALVYVPKKDSDGRLVGELRGKQFRLSHLLATKYGLPIHLTQSVGLSKLLPDYMLLDRARQSIRRRGAGLVDSMPEPSGEDQLPL